jgi:hypothetical protein
MQLYAGRSADQRRGFAALDPRGSEQPRAWLDSTHGRGPGGDQHRSGNGRDADAEHVGMRGERDDGYLDARHDGAGQRNRSRRDTRRIASSVGLLTGMGR